MDISNEKRELDFPNIPLVERVQGTKKRQWLSYKNDMGVDSKGERKMLPGSGPALFSENLVHRRVLRNS